MSNQDQEIEEALDLSMPEPLNLSLKKKNSEDRTEILFNRKAAHYSPLDLNMIRLLNFPKSNDNLKVNNIMVVLPSPLQDSTECSSEVPELPSETQNLPIQIKEEKDIAEIKIEKTETRKAAHHSPLDLNMIRLLNFPKSNDNLKVNNIMVVLPSPLQDSTECSSEVPELPSETQNLPIQIKEEKDIAEIKIEKTETRNIIESKEYIEIGRNKTRIDRKTLEQIKWTSASSATRKLLQIIFTPTILSNHSLTGRPSPAFRDRPRAAKGQLDPKMVEDIISLVKCKTGCSEKIIRSAITSKCADMAKKKRKEQRIKD